MDGGGGGGAGKRTRGRGRGKGTGRKGGRGTPIHAAGGLWRMVLVVTARCR